MPQLIRESSGKGEPTKVDKPPPFRSPPLAIKGGYAKWKQPDPKKETFSGNDHSPKWGASYTPYNNTVNQQLRNELAELRMMVAQNV
ncbi:hypothetical protein ACFX11_008863 [Malus domestica]